MRRQSYGWRFMMLGALASGLVGCGDAANAPAIPPIVPDGQFHPVRFAGSAGAPVQLVKRPGRAGVATAPATATDGLRFWAYTDRDAGISVGRVGTDGVVQPYLNLTIPRGSLLRRPDGSEFLSRDSIEISVTADQQELRIDLEPSGLVFNPLVPAQLTISYQGANPDMNADGAVNVIDDYIEQVLLGLRTSQNPAEGWDPLPSTNDVMSKALSSDLQHFTGYAVSW